MILHYILHQFCILQNWWLPGVTREFTDLTSTVSVVLMLTLSFRDLGSSSVKAMTSLAGRLRSQRGRNCQTGSGFGTSLGGLTYSSISGILSTDKIANRLWVDNEGVLFTCCLWKILHLRLLRSWGSHLWFQNSYIELCQPILQECLELIYGEGPYIEAVWALLTEMSWLPTTEAQCGRECPPACQVYVHWDRVALGWNEVGIRYGGGREDRVEPNCSSDG
jgi:hypothetical protein